MPLFSDVDFVAREAIRFVRRVVVVDHLLSGDKISEDR